MHALSRLTWFLALCALCQAASPNGVDLLFAQWNTPRTPGCAVGILQDGKVALERVYGMADLERNVPITPQSRFYLGSTAKEFTAMTALLLAQQGRLNLEHSVRRYLPSLPPLLEPVKVRHLLEHTSGIRDYIGLWTLSGAGDDTPLSEREALGMIARQKELNFAPGDEFLYSNSGYVLLASLLRPLLLRPFPEIARLVVFDPLGLRSTLYQVDRFGLVPARALGYSPAGGGAYRLNTHTIEVAGDGGLFTTLQDVFTWLRIFESPPPDLAPVIEAMRTPAKLNSGDVAEYGRGLMLKRWRGASVVSHVGGFRGYRSEIFWMPQRRFAAVCLCNTSDVDAGRMARRIADVWLGLGEPPGLKVDLPDLVRKAGVFLDPNSGDVLQLRVEGERLVADYTGFRFPLQAETPMRFRGLDSPIDFEVEFRDAGGRDEPRFLRVESESHRPVKMQRVTLQTKPVTQPGQFTGAYWSEEARSLMRISVVDGRLSVAQSEQQVGTLDPLMEDRFRLGNLNLQFTRNAQGQVTGFRLNTGRLRGLSYVRQAGE